VVVPQFLARLDFLAQLEALTGAAVRGPGRGRLDDAYRLFLACLS
jgi:hypothetical protein